jgi:hypothetical protein
MKRATRNASKTPESTVSVCSYEVFLLPQVIDGKGFGIPQTGRATDLTILCSAKPLFLRTFSVDSCAILRRPLHLKIRG